MKNYRIKKTLIFIMIILILTLVFYEQIIPKNNSAQAVKGVMDLNKWNKDQSTHINLGGEWEFYWNELLGPLDFTESKQPELTGYMKMPFKWGDKIVNNTKIAPYGYATYRLIIKNVEPGMLYAVRIPYMFTSYNLWANGVLISENGKVAKSKEESIPQTVPKVAAVYSKSNQIEIVLQVSNFYNSETKCRDIEFGFQDDIYNDRNISLMLEVFLFGATLMIGFYYIGNYLMRKVEKSNLYFSIFCFLISARTMVFGEKFLCIVIPDINWQLMQKLEYLTIYVMIPIFIMFLSELFPDEISKKLGYLAVLISTFLCIFVILTPQMTFAHTLDFFELICIISVVSIFYRLIKALIHKRDGVETILFGFVILSITIINDILYDRQYAGSKYIFSLGAFVFILCQTLILSKRFTTAFSRQEDLIKTNAELICVIEKEKESLSSEIHSRQTAERLLNEAVEYDKLKNDFLANVSHEFRTPINVIVSSIQMCNLIISSPENEIDISKINNYLRIVKQNSFRLIKLVSNLIDITKIDAGYFKLSLCNCNIISVVEDIAMSVAEFIKDKGIQLVFDTDIEEKVIACDAEKIERIMLNLLSNAVKFTDPGGSIFVTIKSYFDKVRISVKDTGIGISEENLEKIFERFVQVDNTLSRNREGSGIGLSLVRSLVEMHGGKIQAFSEYGHGSEFVFELPAKIVINENQDEVKQCSETANIEKITVEFSDIY